MSELYRYDHDGIDVHFGIDKRDGRYQINLVAVYDVPLTAEFVRSLPLAAVLEEAVEHLDRTPDPHAGIVKGQRMNSRNRDALLEATAFYYAQGLQAGNAPTRHVANRLGVTRRTAYEWVEKARERNLMPDSGYASNKQSPQTRPEV